MREKQRGRERWRQRETESKNKAAVFRHTLFHSDLCPASDTINFCLDIRAFMWVLGKANDFTRNVMNHGGSQVDLIISVYASVGQDGICLIDT